VFTTLKAISHDQPGQDCRGNQQPDIEIENDKNDIENGTHRGGARSGFAAC